MKNKNPLNIWQATTSRVSQAFALALQDKERREAAIDKRNSSGNFLKLPPASWQGQHQLPVPVSSCVSICSLHSQASSHSLLLIVQRPFYTALRDTSATLVPCLSPLLGCQSFPRDKILSWMRWQSYSKEAHWFRRIQTDNKITEEIQHRWEHGGVVVVGSRRERFHLNRERGPGNLHTGKGPQETGPCLINPNVP